MNIIDIILHLDKFLEKIIAQYGPWVYGILFLVVFCETGLLIFPFLPGDSLLFTAGLLGHSGLNIWLVCLTFFFASILGDSTNFVIGKYVGEKLYANPNSKLFKRKHLDTAQAYFDKHGKRTIIIGRFVPIVRTMTPFVAGIQPHMTYKEFIKYSILGSFLWVAICCGAGFLFGKIPGVKENFEIILLAVGVLTLLMAVFEFMKAKKHAEKPIEISQPAPVVDTDEEPA